MVTYAPLLLVVLVLGACTSSGSAPEAAAPAAAQSAAAPFHFRTDLASFDGVIAGREQVRGYSYFLVRETDAGAGAGAGAAEPSHWVASLKKDLAIGTRVHVHAVGEATDFWSKQLQRRFDRLVFGVVRADDTATAETTTASIDTPPPATPSTALTATQPTRSPQ